MLFNFYIPKCINVIYPMSYLEYLGRKEENVLFNDALNTGIINFDRSL